MALKASPNKRNSKNNNDERDPNRRHRHNENRHAKEATEDNNNKSYNKRRTPQKQKQAPPQSNPRVSVPFRHPNTPRFYHRHPPHMPLMSFNYSPNWPVMRSPYYSHYNYRTGYTFSSRDWNSLLNSSLIPTPVYTIPMRRVPATVFSPTSYLTPHAYTYTNTTAPIAPPVTIESVLPTVSHGTDVTSSYTPHETPAHYIDQIVPSPSGEIQNASFETLQDTSNITEGANDEMPVSPVDCYLTLPKSLFPTARMLALDPNPMINALCGLDNIQEHESWLLDLEFGVPRYPPTRPVAVYDAQINSINCRNTQGAIHPAFESCNPDFKNIILFYYDCIISSWYKGYIATFRDKNVANFQSWMQPPMEKYGMCWP